MPRQRGGDCQRERGHRRSKGGQKNGRVNPPEILTLAPLGRSRYFCGRRRQGHSHREEVNGPRVFGLATDDGERVGADMAHLKPEKRIGSMKKSCVEILQIVNCRQITTLSQFNSRKNTCRHARHARNKREKTCARSIVSVGRRGAAASMAPQVSRAIVLRPSSESDTGHIAPGRHR